MPVLAGALCRLRPFRADDADALLAVADDPLVTRWMLASNPHPYAREAAVSWVAGASEESPTNNFAIETDGVLVGATALQPQHGEHEGAAIFGYWLGRRYWGRGLAADAARTLAAHALRERGLRRLQAGVYAPNEPSIRVLEKSGFHFEARLRDAWVDRDGAVHDELIYSRLAGDPDPAIGAEPAEGRTKALGKAAE